MTGAPPSAPRQASAEKAAGAFRTIREVSEELGVPQHVLRFWESRFGQVRPLKRAGGRRYYRPEDVDLLRRIQGLLYQDGYTIRGVQKLFREGGLKAVRTGLGSGAAPASTPAEVRTKPASASSPGVAKPLDRPETPAAVAAPLSRSADAPRHGETASAAMASETRARLAAIADELEDLLALLRG